MNDESPTGTALALPEPTELKALFAKPEGIEAILARIEADARSQAPDLTTAKGRKAITSLAYKVAQTKTALDSAGAELTEAQRKEIAAVDAQRRAIRGRLEALQAEIKAPLIKWEADEAARIGALKNRMLVELNLGAVPSDSAALIALRARIDAVVIDETWQEFQSDASLIKSQNLAFLDDKIGSAIEREAQAAELAKLRAEAAAREEADRLAREAEAAAAAERQRIADDEARRAREAQEATEAARQKAEREAEDLRRQLAETQEREAQAKRDTEAAERKAKEDAERAELARQQVEVEAIERARQKDAQDKLDAERKAEAERQAVADAAARVEADAKYRDAVFAEIVADLSGLPTFTPAAVADALLLGQVRHCGVAL